jgi:hypothetical protein
MEHTKEGMFPNTKIENKCASIRNLGGGEFGKSEEDLRTGVQI